MFIPSSLSQQALLCPQQERRCICSLDMGLMNRILKIDKENMTATVEAVKNREGNCQID
jgi:FAD/FMN-containing dehydrogenase